MFNETNIINTTEASKMVLDNQDEEIQQARKVLEQPQVKFKIANLLDKINYLRSTDPDKNNLGLQTSLFRLEMKYIEVSLAIEHGESISIVDKDLDRLLLAASEIEIALETVGFNEDMEPLVRSEVERDISFLEAEIYYLKGTGNLVASNKLQVIHDLAAQMFKNNETTEAVDQVVEIGLEGARKLLQEQRSNNHNSSEGFRSSENIFFGGTAFLVLVLLASQGRNLLHWGKVLSKAPGYVANSTSETIKAGYSGLKNSIKAGYTGLMNVSMYRQRDYAYQKLTSVIVQDNPNNKPNNP